MAFDAAVTTAFMARDAGMTATLRKITQQSKKFGTTSSLAFKQASAAARRHNTVLKGILQAGVIVSGFALIARGVRSVVTEFVKFDDEIVAANARFKDVVIGTKQADETLKKLKETARAVGKTTQFTGAEAAAGLNFFARAGFKSAEAMAILKNQVDLATATGEDFARVADISSDLLGSLGLNAKDSATKIRNLKEMNNVFAIATNRANVTMENLMETIKDSGPVAVGTGENYKKLIALTAALASSGIKGSTAGTALKNAYSRLVKPTGDVSKGLAALDITQASLIAKSGKLKSLPDIIQRITKAGKDKGLGQAQMMGIFAQIFGLRAMAGAKNLSASMAEIGDSMEAFKDTRGMEKVADVMRGSLGNQVKILFSGLDALGAQFLSAFKTDGEGALKSLTTAVQKFDMTPIIETTRFFVNVIKTLLAVIKPFANIIPVIVVSMIAYNAALRVQMLLQAGGAISSFIRIIKLMMVMNRVRGTSTALQWALNAAMTANPIGITIVAIAALIAISILLVTHWELVRRKFMEWTAIFDRPRFKLLAQIFAPLITIPILIARNWDKVVSVFETAVGLLDKITGFSVIKAQIKKDFAGTQKPKEDEASKDLARSRAQQSTLTATLDVLFGKAPPGLTATAGAGNLAVKTNVGEN